MPPACWPLFELRIKTHDLTLRPMTESDLEQVCRILPADVDMDPAATTYDGVDQASTRSIIVCQSYWKAFGTWRPDAWRLNFMVYEGDSLVGAQELEGNDFVTLRTVDTASFLVASARGRGLGKQMRRAVLTLAFRELGARAAITSAYHDNAASLGVSTSIGYRPNGESFLARGDGVDTLKHLRMTRAEWEETEGQAAVKIEGFAACRPLFGL
ncbi:MAG TPA: GNAT family protein [Actinomycetes bacterium]|nr:GNAT family protein [Actinomycetes bacterium]